MGAILFMLPVALAPAIEHIGGVIAIGSVTGQNYIKQPGLHRTLLGDGLATTTAGMLGGPPNTTYAEVTGAVMLTKNYNPIVMTWAAVFAIALAFIGSLEQYGTLKAIMVKLNKLIKSRLGLVLTTYGSVISVGTLIGDVYTTLVLPGRLLKDKYKEMGYKRTTLTRSIEDAGTLLSPLIPWNMGGSFVAATLGIATLTYAPYAFACWLSPLFGLLWAVLGKFTPREEPSIETPDTNVSIEKI